MDVLCHQVGLTRGALYHHFGNKEGLLEAVILQLDEELGKVILEEWNSHSDEWKGLLSCCELSLKMAMDPVIKKIYHTEGRFVLGERVREIDAKSSIRPMAAVIENLIREGKLKKVDPETLARQINALLMESAIFISESENPKLTYSLAIESFRVIMEGLRTR
ncbi:TetR family transcriptional regulator [Leptospira yanagawae]